RETEARQPDDREEKQSDGGLDIVELELRGGESGRTAGVVHEDVDAAVPVNGSVHETFDVLAARDVTWNRERIQPLGFALEQVSSASEHDDVRAFFGQGLGDPEPDARRRAADDRRPALESEFH